VGEDACWHIDTPSGLFCARALVNAAGPGVGNVLSAIGEEGECGIRRVRGSHIVVAKLFDHPYAYFFQLPDGRIFFAMPYQEDFTLIGTTDAEHTGPLDDVRASEAEIEYLCNGVNQYFRQQISPADVVWTYAGVRPLIDDGSGKPEAATRGYRLTMSEEGAGPPLLNVYGGKITSYRHLAQEATDMLAERLGSITDRAWTGDAPLPGGDFAIDDVDPLLSALKARYPFLDDKQAQRIARAYGTLAYTWLGAAQRWGDLGRDFGAGLTEAEVGYLRREEWAQTSDDILWRRTKLGLRFSETQKAELAVFLENSKS